MQTFQCKNPACIYNTFTFSLNVLHGDLNEVTCPNCGSLAILLGSGELTPMKGDDYAADINRSVDGPVNVPGIRNAD